MKPILILSVSCALFCSGCKKGEVPSNDTKYIGVWKNSGAATTDTYQLTIHSDGKAEYAENTTSGVTYSSKTVTGYIYFDNDDFKIGSNLINKKFKADKPPTRVTTSVVPYTYYYIGTFNGVEYTKTN